MDPDDDELDRFEIARRMSRFGDGEPDMLTRLLNRSHHEPPPPGLSGDCLIWDGARNNNGYGYVATGRKGAPVGVHRLAWEMRHGPVPPGLHVLHRCDRPACWAVGHLWLGTRADNMADMATKGRAVNGNERKMHCKRGHPLTYRRSNGARTCRYGSECGLVQRILTSTGPLTAAIREFILAEMAAGRQVTREQLQERFGASSPYANKLLRIIKRYGSPPTPPSKSEEQQPGNGTGQLGIGDDPSTTNPEGA